MDHRETDQRESRPSPVPATATQDGDATSTGGVRHRWAWVEWSVWTARMLTALEQGVKGPDAYLHQRGPHFLSDAHRLACQSCRT